MRGRRLALGGVLAVALFAAASPAAAHPLGNATVSRAISVTLGIETASIAYVVDMAEIPAFSAQLDMDRDGDGRQSSVEQGQWAGMTCQAIAAAVEAVVDDQPVEAEPAGSPELTFPPGVGGLDTLRLACPLFVALSAASGQHTVAITDVIPDERPGWREVTIRGTVEVEVVVSDVPAISPSGMLTAYPADLLSAPIDVRSGRATYEVEPLTGGTDAAATPAAAGDRPIAEDPLSSLLGGSNSPLAWLVGLGLAMALGAAHALSPGHGKALIAAYVLGSQSAPRHAIGLGLTTAASHTVGVLILGLVVLSASELLVPDRVIAWLSVGSGLAVVVVGALVGARVLRSRRHADAHQPEHEGDSEHRHTHEHGHSHDRRDTHQGSALASHSPLREVLTLGLVGGAIPSTSALLVLLAAVATGRLVEGMLLIVAFGSGMAIVLGGLAAITGVAGSRLARAIEGAGRPMARRLVGAAPLASAMFIMAVGAVTAIGALGSL